MHILKARTHGYLDYAAILFLFLMPSLFDLTGTPASLAYGLAIGYVALVALTAYPLGLFKLIPFSIHGAVEFALAIGLAAAPWMFRFAGEPVARNLYVALGAILFVVWLVTDYRTAADSSLHRTAAHH